MIIGSPVPNGPIHATSWKRPAGNHEPRLVRGFSSYHDGIDVGFGRPYDPILAAAAGRVYFVGRYADGALNVAIQHADGWRTMYGHLDDATVREGETVGQGDMIGHCGFSGYTVPEGPAGAHLHFELFDPTLKRFNPWPHLEQNVRVRPDGSGVYLRTEPNLATSTRYAITKPDGRIHRMGTDADLGSTSAWRRWRPPVQGTAWGGSNRWDRIYLGRWLYIHSNLADRSHAGGLL